MFYQKDLQEWYQFFWQHGRRKDILSFRYVFWLLKPFFTTAHKRGKEKSNKFKLEVHCHPFFKFYIVLLLVGCCTKVGKAFYEQQYLQESEEASNLDERNLEQDLDDENLLLQREQFPNEFHGRPKLSELEALKEKIRLAQQQPNIFAETFMEDDTDSSGDGNFLSDFDSYCSWFYLGNWVGQQCMGAVEGAHGVMTPKMEIKRRGEAGGEQRCR